MATTIVDWANDGTLPQTKTSGNWTPSNFNAGKFRQPWSPTNASTHSTWRPASLTYWAVLTTNDVNGAALWIEWDPGTSTHRFLVVAVDGSTFLAAVAVTWAAAPSGMRYTVDQSSAAAGASTLALEGFATGNGTTSGWTRASIFPGANLYLGVWGAGGFGINASTFGDIDDGNDSVAGAATLTVPAAISTTGQLTRNRSATMAAAAAITTTATPTRNRAATLAAAAAIATTAVATRQRLAAVNVPAVITTGLVRGIAAAATLTIAATIATDLTKTSGASGAAALAIPAAITTTGELTRNRAATLTVPAALATTGVATRQRAATLTVPATLTTDLVGSGSFGPGSSSSAINPIASGTAATLTAPGGFLPGGGSVDADGRTPTAVNVRAGSAILAFFGRPAAASGSLTDNDGGTFTDRFVEPVVGWPDWETGIALRLNVGAKTGYQVTTPSVANDEATLSWAEYIGAGRIGATTSVFRASGTTQISAAVDLDGPGWVDVSWCGDAGTYGAEGFDWTVQAVGEGVNLGDWQVVEHRLKNHTNGWIQHKRWRRYFPTGGTGIQLTINAATLEPTQGARFYATPIQDAFHSGAVLTVPAALDTTATVTRSRSAALTIPAAIATTGELTRNRAAELAVPAAIATEITRGLTGAAEFAVPAAIATTGTLTRQRAAELAIAAALATTLDHTPTVHGAASLAIPAELATTGTLTRNRSAAAAIAASLTTTGTLTRNRAAALTVPAAIHTNLDNPADNPAGSLGFAFPPVAPIVDDFVDEIETPDPDTV